MSMIVAIFSSCLMILGVVLAAIELRDYDLVKKEIKKYNNSEKLGREGEQEVSNVLMTLPHDNCVVINNLLYLHNNRTHQIDHIVVSNYGIFIIETKNYPGSIYGSDRYNTWNQYLGKNRYKFLNPVLQNYGHVKALENKIPEYKDFFVPIVCFTNKSKLKVKSRNYVVNLSDLLNVILNYKTDVLIPDIFEVAQNLKNLSLDLSGAEEHHIDNIRKNM